MTDKMNATEWAAINEIIASIYSATPFPDLIAIVRKLKLLLPFSNAVSCLISDSDSKVEFFQHKSDTIPESHLDLYCEKYVYYDFILWYCAAPKELVFRESDVINEKFVAESIFMKEWMEPIGAYYGAVMNIAGNEHSFANICLYRSKEEVDFSDKELLILRTINEHLCICFRNLFPNGILRSSISHTANRLSNIYHLTQRETNIVLAISSGTLRNQLAKELFISENTVKKHLNSIYQKMDVKNFGELLKIVNPVKIVLG